MNTFMKLISLILLTMLVSACSAPEDETSTHEENGSAAMSDGLEWHGTIYAEGEKQKHNLGMFTSRLSCEEAAMMYMKENNRQGSTYSCGTHKTAG